MHWSLYRLHYISWRLRIDRCIGYTTSVKSHIPTSVYATHLRWTAMYFPNTEWKHTLQLVPFACNINFIQTLVCTMSQRYDKPSLIAQCFYGKGDQESDSYHGYHRMEQTEQKSSTTSKKQSPNTHGRVLHSTNCHQTPDSNKRAEKKSDTYTKMDAKGKRLSNTLRRKEVSSLVFI